MSDKNLENRIKAEGQLLRNTGTNSIKSMNNRLDKFSIVFDSINKTLIEQNVLLQGLVDFEIEKKKNEELKRVSPTITPEEEEAIKNRTYDDRDDYGIPTNTSGSILGNFFASVIGGASGAMALGGMRGFISQVVRAIPYALLAPAVGGFIGRLTELGLEGIGFDNQEFITGFSGAMERTASWAIIGSFFGRRYAAVLGAAGLGSALGEQLLDAMGFEETDVINAFGAEINASVLANVVGGLVGSSLMMALTGPAFANMIRGLFSTTAIVNAAGDTTSTPAFNTRRMLIGATLSSAILGAYIAYGDDLKRWIETQEFPMPVAGIFTTGIDIASMGATGAAFGMMFGPQGALAGAAIGFAIGIGQTLYNWIVNARSSVMETFNNQAQEMYNLLQQAADGSPITAEQQQTIANAGSEARRLLEIGGTDVEMQTARGVATAASNYFATQPLTPDGVSNEQLSMRVLGALSGNQQSFSELIEFSRQMNPNDWISMLRDTLFTPGMENFIVDNPESITRWNQMIDQVEQRERMQTPIDLSPIERPIIEDTSNQINQIQEYLNSTQQTEPLTANRTGLLETLSRMQQTIMNNVVIAPTTNAPVSIVQGGSTSSIGVSNTVIGAGGQYGGLPGIAN